MVSKLDIFYLPTRSVMCTIFAALLGLTFSSFLKLKIQELYLTFPPNMVTRDKEEGCVWWGKKRRLWRCPDQGPNTGFSIASPWDLVYISSL